MPFEHPDSPRAKQACAAGVPSQCVPAIENSSGTLVAGHRPGGADVR